MISVLSHELMHIADGDNDSLRPLVSAVGSKASELTGLDVHGQRGEEITCDLIGAMASRAYVASTPGYESIARRLARVDVRVIAATNSDLGRMVNEGACPTPGSVAAAQEGGRGENSGGGSKKLAAIHCVTPVYQCEGLDADTNLEAVYPDPALSSGKGRTQSAFSYL